MLFEKLKSTHASSVPLNGIRFTVSFFEKLQFIFDVELQVLERFTFSQPATHREKPG